MSRTTPPAPPRAPRLTRLCLRLALTRDVRDDITGDLDERLATDAAALGAPAARRRYRRRALALAAGFFAERVRDRVRAIARVRFSLLDVRLGLRMLARYPVLTVVGMVSLALAIALGAAAFAFLTLMLWPRLPLPDGDRIKTVTVVDQAANQEELRVTADFLRWRDRTSTLVDWSAGRRVSRNLKMGDDIVEAVGVQQATPSMFRLTGVDPLMGRTLTDDDARPGAPPVMVLGERIWRERFGADPDIVGRALILAETPTAVVGVMPAAYRFPATDEIWMPLTLDANTAPRSGLGMRMWARLAPGATPAEAAAELAALSARSAADWPATHARLQAALRSPAVSMVNDPEERAILGWLRFAAGLLVLLVSGNVALLMFARAATRESELLVRTALGASRARLIGQFVAEALVLNSCAAVAGLWLAGRTMHWAVITFARVANDGELLPFWITPTLPPASLVFGVALAALATAMTGILPAAKLTKGVSSRLRETTAGAGGLKFGGVWTVLIVTQIAVTVYTPSLVYFLRRDMHLSETQDIGVPAAAFITAQLGPGSIASRPQYDAAVERVRADLAAMPGVTAVSVADKLPLMWNGYYEIQVDEGGAAPPTSDSGDAYPISTAAVEPDFFSTFEAPALAGRLFTPSDYQGTARVIVVNRAFVTAVLGGRNAIGRRIRYRRASNSGQAPPDQKVQPWLEIVGVVRDLGMAKPPGRSAGVYLPLNRQLVDALMITARVSGDVPAAASRLRAIAANADPRMRLADVQPLSQVRANAVQTLNYVSRLFGVVSLAALVLALTGIFAVMSFAVSRRTREIGIRVALGSTRGRVVLAILRRPLIQVSLGILVGTLPLLLWLSENGAAMPDMDPAPTSSHLAVAAGLAGYVVAMILVCLAACVVPIRRALKVDPIAALRAE